MSDRLFSIVHRCVDLDSDPEGPLYRQLYRGLGDALDAVAPAGAASVLR